MSFSEFQKSSKKFSSQEIRFVWLVSVGLLLLVAGNILLARILPPSGEFLLLRESGRAFMFERIEPYSTGVPAQVQERTYGRAAREGEEPYILDVPFHLLVLYFPFALGSEALARGLFFFFLELALFFVVFFGMRLAGWEPSVLYLLLFFAVSLLNFYVVNSFLNGAPTVFLTLAYVGIIICLHHEQDELAGALLVFSCFQWEIGAPFLLFIFFYLFHHKRWHVLVGFGMLAFVLLVVAYLLYPGWPLSFLRASYSNSIINYGFSMRSLARFLWPGQSTLLGWILTALLAIVLGYEWNRVDDKNFRRFYWTACLTLAITPLLGFRVELEQLVVLVLPLGLIMQVVSDRWHRFGGLFALIFLGLYFVLPWMIYIEGVPQFGHKALVILFLFLPLLTVLSLYWIRWWVIRPPRTWVDEIGATR